MEIQGLESVLYECCCRLGGVATPPIRHTNPVPEVGMVVNSLNLQADATAQFVSNRDRKARAQTLIEPRLAGRYELMASSSR
jgi:hypothetical protein